MTEELEDIKFREYLEDSRFKEIKKTLSVIANALSQKNDEGIIAAIKENADAIEKFSDAIKKIPAPEVKVENKNDFSSLEKIGNDILKGQEVIVTELKKLHEWSFSFHRQSGGFIESPITAKQIK